MSKILKSSMLFALITAVLSFGFAVKAVAVDTDAGALKVPPVSASASSATKHQSQFALSDYTGRTLMEFLAGVNGLRQAFGGDIKEPFIIPGKDVIHAAVAGFDPIVYKKIMKMFSGGQAGFDQLLDSLNGVTATPATLAGAIGKRLQDMNLVVDQCKIGLYAVSIAPFLSLASGAGVSVAINEHNAFLNIGYKTGYEGETALTSGACSAPSPADREMIEKAVKSGRSYGISPGHKALDVSDVYYLRELHAYITHNTYSPEFYKTLFSVLTRCDVSGYSSMSVPAQTVATDFIAVYTAEMSRNAMTNFTAHAWQNDLAEVTFVSAYSSKSRKVVTGGKLVEGEPEAFFGVSSHSTGTGIGITRNDRKKLQAAITRYETKNHPELVSAVKSIVGGKPGGDVFHEIMLFINNPANQAQVSKSGVQLTNAAVAFLTQVSADAPAITAEIQKTGL